MSSTDFLANIKTINTALGDGDSILYLTTTNADNLHLSAIDKLNTDTGKQLGYVTNQNGKMVAISAKGNLIYSEDGVNWVSANMLTTDDEYTSWGVVAYGGDKFVALANSEYSAYSEDGINWTVLPQTFQNSWDSITYGDGKFVAVHTYYGDRVAYSYDGINWDYTSLPVYLGEPTHITYGNGVFVVPAFRGICYSTNAIDWTEIILDEDYKLDITCIAYGNGKFVGLARYDYTTNYAIYSENGINWTQTELPESLIVEMTSITYGNGKFVAVDAYGSIALYSEDGLNWTQTELPGTYEWTLVVYGGGKFVAVSKEKEDGIATYSDDGITWKQTSLPTKAYWNYVTYGGPTVLTSTPLDVTLSLKISRTGDIYNAITIDLIYNSGKESTYIYSCIYNKESNTANDTLSDFVVTTDPKGFVSKAGGNIAGNLTVNGTPVANKNDIGKINENLYQLEEYIDYVRSQIPTITASTTDLEAGVSALPAGHIYLVLE
jgi:hypothetical protein